MVRSNRYRDSLVLVWPFTHSDDSSQCSSNDTYKTTYRSQLGNLALSITYIFAMENFTRDTTGLEVVETFADQIAGKTCKLLLKPNVAHSSNRLALQSSSLAHPSTRLLLKRHIALLNPFHLLHKLFCLVAPFPKFNQFVIVSSLSTRISRYTLSRLISQT